jgi:hypothetical protein
MEIHSEMGTLMPDPDEMPCGKVGKDKKRAIVPWMISDKVQSNARDRYKAWACRKGIFMC